MTSMLASPVGFSSMMRRYWWVVLAICIGALLGVYLRLEDNASLPRGVVQASSNVPHVSDDNSPALPSKPDGSSGSKKTDSGEKKKKKKKKKKQPNVPPPAPPPTSVTTGGSNAPSTETFPALCEKRAKSLRSSPSSVVAAPVDSLPESESCMEHTLPQHNEVDSFFAADGEVLISSMHKHFASPKSSAHISGGMYCVVITVMGDANQAKRLLDAGFCRKLEIIEASANSLGAYRAKFGSHPDVCYSDVVLGDVKADAYLHPSGEETYVDLSDGKDVAKLQMAHAADYVSSLVEAGEKNIFLYVDCNGCEYRLFKALGEAGVLPCIHAAQVQFHRAESAHMEYDKWHQAYCDARAHMAQTMNQRFSFYLVWDIWVRRGGVVDQCQALTPPKA